MSKRKLVLRGLLTEASDKRRNLIGACVAHALHDGYTDLLYVLLPLWKIEYGLSYAGLGIVRALYNGTMGGLQVPGNRLMARFDPRTSLVLATLVAAFGYFMISLPFGFPALCLGLVVAGIGSSVQHPRGALFVTNTYGASSRGPLGIYNFAGDLGKSVFPAVVALLVPIFAWRPVVGLMSGVGVAAAVSLLWIIPRSSIICSSGEPHAANGTQIIGFRLLLAMGVLDTAPRMGYLLFLPFLIQAKGGTTATVGMGLALLFIGGAFGKAACGWLGEHLGIVKTVIATETATALLMAVSLVLPLVMTMAALPLLGVALNGTSSVLYGTVPELAPKGDTGRAFAMFYTGTIVSGGLAPIAYGVIADSSSRSIAILVSAFTAIAVVPLVLALRPFLVEKI
jgi:MFS transporter, FSR family, fosmidomycin resistance protein